MIASQYNNLDIQRRINLLSLTNTLGDQKLFEERKESIVKDLDGSCLQESIDKISSQCKPDAQIIFDPENGPRSSRLEEKQGDKNLSNLKTQKNSTKIS